MASNFDCLQALDDANLGWREGGLDKLDLLRCGILIGTAMGGMQTFAKAVEDLTTKVCALPPDKALFKAQAGKIHSHLVARVELE